MDAMNDISMYVAPCTNVEVERLVKSLVNKTNGINSIPTFMYKKIINIISPVIATLFNKSIEEGIFPSCLKVARVIPIFKEGDRADVNNYRPISLLPFLSKVFEKLMYSRLNIFLTNNNILKNNQFGFRKNICTEDALLEFLNDAYNSLNSKKIFTVVYLDFSKAFDTVSHSILLSKLERVGVRGVVNNWFRSFLTSRRQYVHTNGCDSDTERINCGVAQGSILGPLLFILYINDFAKVCNRLKCIHYADDTTLYFAHDNIENITSVFNDEMIAIDRWLIANRLSINFKKMSYMTISNASYVLDIPLYLRNVRLKICNHTKLLGIIIDNNLNFHKHVDAVCSKLARSVGTIRRICNLLPQEIMVRLYFSLLYPYMTYCVTAFGDSNVRNINKIERIQFKFCKILDNNRQDRLCLLKELNILPFKDVYNFFTLMKFYKCINLNQHVYFLTLFNQYIPQHDHFTRFTNEGNLNIPNVRLSRCRKSFMFNAINI